MLHTVHIITRALSFFYPVRIKRSKGANDTTLDLSLYRNQWQLSTKDAIYSDGNRYRPLVVAFKEIESILPGVRDVLILGTGLGSAVMILEKKGFHPNVTLIDHDETSLRWAQDLFDNEAIKRVELLCIDAKTFISANEKCYDLIVIDIFEGRKVPAFVTDDDFLQKCRQSLNSGGKVVFNYIVDDIKSWNVIREKFKKIFPQNNILKLGLNQIIIATALQTEYVILFYSSFARAFFRELISIFHP